MPPKSGKCPICDIVHGHDVDVDVDRTKRPQVVCTQNADHNWETLEYYNHWVETKVPELLKQYRQTGPLVEVEDPWKKDMEEMEHERMKEVKKGGFDPRVSEADLQ